MGWKTSVSENDVGDVQVLEVSDERKRNPPRVNKCNSFWCPITDCTSGPVQKMAQHLRKKHGLTSSRAAALARRDGHRLRLFALKSLTHIQEVVA